MQPNRVWSTAYKNDLPDSAFLYVEPGGSKDSAGRTVPRTLRHFPYKNANGSIDIAHLKNALSRIPQSNLPESVKTRVERKASEIYMRHGGYESNVSTKGRVLSAFDELNEETGGQNYVTLLAMRERLPDLSRSDFDRALNDLRRDWVLSLDSADGRHVRISQEVRDAGVTEGGQRLVYASRRDYSPNSSHTFAIRNRRTGEVIRSGRTAVDALRIMNTSQSRDWVVVEEDGGREVSLSELSELAAFGNRTANPPPPPPRRRMPPRPPVRASRQRERPTLERVRGIVREHEEQERPFDPERAPTWRGSARDLTVNARRTDKGLTELYLNPYADVEGFYVSSAEEALAAEGKLRAKGAEEYSVDFIDGSKSFSDLFEALKPGPQDLKVWFEVIEVFDDDQIAALYYYAGENSDWRDGVEEVEERRLEPWPREGTVRQYAEELVDDIGIEGVSNPEYYFDYDSFGRDLQLSGDLTASAEDDEERERLEEHYDGMSDQEIGEEFVEELGGLSELPKNTREQYFDYDALARDMELNGDVNEFSVGGVTYNVDNR